LIKGKHKKYFLDEKVPKFDDEVYFVLVRVSKTK
jgi:type III pantothenate kinase